MVRLGRRTRKRRALQAQRDRHHRKARAVPWAAFLAQFGLAPSPDAAGIHKALP